ncbi:VOC family protein [Asanoa siamensis]|uniref:Glyoxalase n=1 Tax=Asanoa siamensis TaxID=926357 RepID=A0ABQ4CKJ8_9ACTN|nr:VOC family protein [Asanoa siamensis]GIF71362.1 glyoxalase [Asanoa siamensis]
MELVTELIPRIVVADGPKAVAFYERALGATEGERHTDDAGRIVHTELTVGSSRIHLKDEGDGDPAPTSLGGTPVLFHLGVTDADAAARALVEAGATVVFPVAERGYGSKDGRLADPFGHLWIVSEPVVEG